MVDAIQAADADGEPLQHHLTEELLALDRRNEYVLFHTRGAERPRHSC